MNKAILGDCMAIMPTFPNAYFDLAVVDPPYFSGPEKRRFYGSEKSTTGIKRKDYPVIEKWEVPQMPYFNEVKRVAKNWIIWGYNYFEFCHIGVFKTPRRGDIQDFIKQNPTGWIVWDKVNGNTSFNDFELAYTSFDQPTRIFTYMWNGAFQGKSIALGHIQEGDKSKNQQRIHPTEKPINLYKWIFKEYTHARDKVLDTHLGSGSIRLAALNFDIDFLGIEMNQTHFSLQEHRYSESTKQLRLPLI